jgi:hypothetical protein
MGILSIMATWVKSIVLGLLMVFVDNMSVWKGVSSISTLPNLSKKINAPQVIQATTIPQSSLN